MTQVRFSLQLKCPSDEIIIAKTVHLPLVPVPGMLYQHNAFPGRTRIENVVIDEDGSKVYAELEDIAVESQEKFDEVLADLQERGWL